MIRIGFGGLFIGLLYYNYNEDPPPKKKKSVGNYEGP